MGDIPDYDQMPLPDIKDEEEKNNYADIQALNQKLQLMSSDQLLDQNKECITVLEKTKEEQLKFTNPLRDYSHLLSGRLVVGLLRMDSLVSDYTNGLIPHDLTKKKKKKKKKGKGKKKDEEEEKEEEEQPLPSDELPRLPSKRQIEELRRKHK